MSKVMEDRIKEEKVNNTVENIKSLMENMKWTVEQAMKVLNIPEADYEIYKKRV